MAVKTHFVLSRACGQHPLQFPPPLLSAQGSLDSDQNHLPQGLGGTPVRVFQPRHTITIVNRLMFFHIPQGFALYHPGWNHDKIFPRNNDFCNNLCNSYRNNSTRAFSLQCCCHWFVPVCKRACKGICFVKRLFCNLYKLIVPKHFFWKVFFVIILAAMVPPKAP